MNKKKIGIIVAVLIVIAATGGGAWYFLNGNFGIGNSSDKVYVEKVSSLNTSNMGVQNRYSGVVEAQESWKVNKEPDREVKELFVEQGDMVEEGDQLFEYNMEDVQSELDQAQLDLEGMENEITDYRTQINQLTQERNAAPADEKYQYTADIQEKENSIKQTEYNIESKKAEMEKKQESIDNAIVTSKIAGVVKSINKSGSGDGGYDDDSAYMTILAVGDYRVKGTVSETNVQMLSEQQSVILRSRIDEEQTWTGMITKIDTQNQAGDESNDMMMYDGGGGTERATKYPFYITLDSTDGLMMGQHLYIELDQGQTEEKEGIWLFEGYLVFEDANAEEAEDMGEDAEGGEGAGLEGEADADGSVDGDEAGADGFVDGDEADADGFVDGDEAGADGFVDGDEADADGFVDGDEADADGFVDGDEADTEGGLGEFADGDEADAEGGLGEFADGGEAGLDESAEDMTADGAGMGAGQKTAYVWAANDKNKLEKRQVELGEYDEMTGEYEILSGLTEDDYIAFPMEGLYEGITTVTNIEDVDYTSPLYNQGEDGEESEDGETMEDGEGLGDEEYMEDGEDFGDEEYMEDEEDAGDGEDMDDDSAEDDTLTDLEGLPGDGREEVILDESGTL